MPVSVLEPQVDPHPRVDLIDLRGPSLAQISGRLVSQSARRAEVLLLEPGERLQPGTRLVVRWPAGRMTGVVVQRTDHMVTLEVRKVHRTDQRTFPRVSGGMRCLCRFGTDWSWPKHLIDISVGGVLLVTDAPVNVDDSVMLMLGLHHNPGPWRLRGTVVRVLPQGSDFRVGIEFNSLSERARTALLRHCNAWLRLDDDIEP